ncbi:hypothetical protein OTB20_30290 [Streptomyces sp. H27-H1]|uniref:hypothetical protein n=1 Tax=Streptomyces sp. H27-H1 TaxID=2996461 RepID=UPI00226E2DD3|nr:hypothetical protein [Streptomyces sp. H27-H1]MCY0930405.1 hypothetical protein [Streptomyces sp. H27-H1]
MTTAEKSVSGGKITDDLPLLARLDAGQSPERVTLGLRDPLRATAARRPEGRRLP